MQERSDCLGRSGWLGRTLSLSTLHALTRGGDATNVGRGSAALGGVRSLSLAQIRISIFAFALS